MNRDHFVRIFAGSETRSATTVLPKSGEVLLGEQNLNLENLPDGPLIPAAVLIPLIDRPDGLSVLLTQRTETLAHHAGQISFPGGHVEDHDRDPRDTALRETEEEIGLDRSCIEILGRLDDYATSTGFKISPFVGFIKPPLALTPDPKEVSEVFEVPLEFLMNPANHQVLQRTYKGVNRKFYAITYGDYYIWGATAGMLVNLYRMMEQ